MSESALEPVHRVMREAAAAIGSMPEFDAARGASVLVTGAAGMIGSWLALAFLEASRRRDLRIEVHGLSRNMRRADALFAGLPLHAISRDVAADPGDLPAFDYVIHAASPVGPALFAERPFDVADANLTGTVNLLRKAAKDKTRRFVFISTHEVYGAGKTMWREDDSGTLDFFSPRACYPESKRAGENACVCAWNQYGLDTGIARLSRIYGPGMNLDSGLFVCDFFKDILAGRDIVVRGNGALPRPLLHVADATKALVKILFRGAPGTAYNVAPSERRSIADIASLLAAMSGRKAVFSAPPVPVDGMVQDTAWLEALGWREAVPLRNGLEDMLGLFSNARR